MKIAIYVQGCILAGRRAWAIERAGDWESGDVWVLERDEARMREIAEGLDREARTAPAGTDIYYMRTARTIREAIGD